MLECVETLLRQLLVGFGGRLAGCVVRIRWAPTLPLRSEEVVYILAPECVNRGGSAGCLPAATAGWRRRQGQGATGSATTTAAGTMRQPVPW